MNSAEIEAALGEVFDQSIVFHGFTDYMRDYEMVTFSVADRRTGIEPRYDRYLFRHTVEATVCTTLSAETWRVSLDDRLTDFETAKDLDGYVWGVKSHDLYPGASLVVDSPRAGVWAERIGIEFYEVNIETNAHAINLVFADLELVSAVPGYAPFVIDGSGR